MSGRLMKKSRTCQRQGARYGIASHVRAMVAEGAKVMFGDILDERAGGGLN